MLTAGQGAIYNGLAFKGKICGVSILRAGEVNRLRCILSLGYPQFYLGHGSRAA